VHDYSERLFTPSVTPQIGLHVDLKWPLTTAFALNASRHNKEDKYQLSHPSKEITQEKIIIINILLELLRKR